MVNDMTQLWELAPSSNSEGIPTSLDDTQFYFKEVSILFSHCHPFRVIYSCLRFCLFYFGVPPALSLLFRLCPLKALPRPISALSESIQGMTRKSWPPSRSKPEPTVIKSLSWKR